MFIAPIAKNLESTKSIVRPIADKLHEYVRYDAKGTAFPAIEKAINEVEYFSPSSPLMQASKSASETVGKVLDIIVK